MHGAGLANLIFCKQNTSVVEIVPDLSSRKEDWYCKYENLKDKTFIRNHFVNISNLNKLNHHLYFSVNFKNNDKTNKQFVNLTKTDLLIDMKMFSNFYNSLIDKF